MALGRRRGGVVRGEVEVRVVGAVDGHGRPVVGDGRVDGVVEGAQPVALAAVGLADLGHPLAPPALPDTAEVVARVVWATHPSLSWPRPFSQRLGSGSGTVAGEGLLPSCCAARQYTSLNISANQDDSMMAMLSAGMYDQDSIRIGMNPATYDLLLLQGSCEGFFIMQNANM